jgi:hypothetical protein
VDQVPVLVPIGDFQVKDAFLIDEQGDLQLKGGSFGRRFVRRHRADTRQVVEGALEPREWNGAAVAARHHPSVPLLPNEHAAYVSRDANFCQCDANSRTECDGRRTCRGQNNRPDRMAMTVIQVRLRGSSTRLLLTGPPSRSRDPIGLSGFLGVAA